MKLRWLVGLEAAFIAISGLCALNGSFFSSPKGGTVLKGEAPVKEVSPKAAALDDYGGTRLNDNTDVNIKLKIISATRSDVCQSYNYAISMSDEDQNDIFILGYYGEGASYLPLTFVYKVTKADGSIVERTTEASQKTQSSLYDSLGYEFGNDPGSELGFSFSSSADFFIAADETIDIKSLTVLNVYPAIRDTATSTYVPDKTKKYYINSPTVYSGAKTDYNLSQFFKTDLNKVTSFKGVTSLTCSYYDMADSVAMLKARMDALDPKYWTDHMKRKDNGLEGIRCRFQAVTNSSFHIIMKDGSVYDSRVKIETANGISWIDLDLTAGKFHFLINGLDSANVQAMYLKNVSFRTEFYAIDSMKSASNTESTFDYRFGAIPCLTADQGAPAYEDLNLTLILTALIYTAVFAALDFLYFLYKRNKYKNDEYLRVIPAQFFKTSGLAYVTLGLAIFDVLFIVCRSNDLNNSVIVKNPTDAFILVFSIALIIMIGYFVRFFIIAFKNHREKKRTDLLKINETKADDGTMVMSQKPKMSEETKTKKKTAAE
jgi:hypothetical protein